MQPIPNGIEQASKLALAAHSPSGASGEIEFVHGDVDEIGERLVVDLGRRDPIRRD